MFDMSNMSTSKIHCCIPSCSSSRSRVEEDNQSSLQKDKEAITFHQFPKNPERYKLWVETVFGKYFKFDDICPKKVLYLCSKHFTPDDFIESFVYGELVQSKPKKTIKRTAVPSIDLPIHASNIKSEYLKKFSKKRVRIKRESAKKSKSKPIILFPTKSAINTERLRRLQEGKKRIAELIKQNEELFKCSIHAVTLPTCSFEACVLKSYWKRKIEVDDQLVVSSDDSDEIPNNPNDTLVLVQRVTDEIGKLIEPESDCYDDDTNDFRDQSSKTNSNKINCDNTAQSASILSNLQRKSKRKQSFNRRFTHVEGEDSEEEGEEELVNLENQKKVVNFKNQPIKTKRVQIIVEKPEAQPNPKKTARIKSATEAVRILPPLPDHLALNGSSKYRPIQPKPSEPSSLVKSKLQSNLEKLKKIDKLIKDNNVLISKFDVTKKRGDKNIFNYNKENQSLPPLVPIGSPPPASSVLYETKIRNQSKLIERLRAQVNKLETENRRVRTLEKQNQFLKNLVYKQQLQLGIKPDKVGQRASGKGRSKNSRNSEKLRQERDIEDRRIDSTDDDEDVPIESVISSILEDSDTESVASEWAPEGGPSESEDISDEDKKVKPSRKRRSRNSKGEKAKASKRSKGSDKVEDSDNTDETLDVTDEKLGISPEQEYIVVQVLKEDGSTEVHVIRNEKFAGHALKSNGEHSDLGNRNEEYSSQDESNREENCTEYYIQGEQHCTEYYSEKEQDSTENCENGRERSTEKYDQEEQSGTESYDQDSRSDQSTAHSGSFYENAEESNIEELDENELDKHILEESYSELTA